MKLRIMHDAEPYSCRGVYYIRTSEIAEAILNIMVHVWLEESVFLGQVLNDMNMQDNISVEF